MSRRRVRLDARGAVQGVGFRPTVFRLAGELGLGGTIRNHPGGVEIEVEGTDEAVRAFLTRLPGELPRHARLQALDCREVAPRGEPAFRIVESRVEGTPTTRVLPDLATCPHCLRELRDPGDRRYRYPFSNCTLCGPRYSILLSLPYDRGNTTMRGFPMCPACRAEYEDPGNRRFHAQPTACPECGPQLALWGPGGEVLTVAEGALQGAAEALRRGDVVAVKGLGGFHLLVDARSPEAVARLRRRKHREEKPLAVMAPGMAWVARACHASPAEERLLASPAAPIVLLRRRAQEVAPEVAPGAARLGVLLPYTPLHHLLMDEVGFPVVATSGNRSEEPLCVEEAEALERLDGVADLFLVHDRPIARPVDDSVAQVVVRSEQVLRLARGYAPLALDLPEGLEAAGVLGVGGHMKSAVALGMETGVVVSQHLGDLDSSLSREHFEGTWKSLARLSRFTPKVAACDPHPDYASTRFATSLGLPVCPVQHHVAHVYAGLLDAGWEGPVLGVAWDGTGLGPDGTVWGGEFLRVDGAEWERVGCLRPFLLPGGEMAVREPRRSALGVLHEVVGTLEGPWAPVGRFTPAEVRVLGRMLSRGVACTRTTSAGRLFDAVASLLDLRHHNAFEGQAAMALEAAAGEGRAEPYPFTVEGGTADWGPAVEALLADLAAGVPREVLSARFHETMAALVVEVARTVGEDRVLLTGGCFQNARLTERTVCRLRSAGFRAGWHRRLPPNDGGLAAGQVLAAALFGRETRRASGAWAGVASPALAR